MQIKGLLREIGKANQTDKADLICFGQSYLDIYEPYFESIRTMVRSVLEFGVAAGGSLRTWRDYFPNAEIYGVDVNPEALTRECDRVHVMCCSQDSQEVVTLGESMGGLDIVVDDGSHVNQLTVASFRNVWPLVKHGGFYVIEDTGLTHDTDVAADAVRGGWPGMQHNRPGINMVNRRAQIDALLCPLIRDMDCDKGEVEFMHFWSKTVVIKKL